ncbi:uncharacterized protein LOC114518121 [Dendronephthya gigantea]|uniref:uncharacterized protein LOC114518121 n=1 Tax=Dendronephthya gigantea TaxID=151771 RepID=UPI00106919DC|nr:uncharacterized protein LOC114518121 [Dendronephthya gigantea]
MHRYLFVVSYFVYLIGCIQRVHADRNSTQTENNEPTETMKCPRKITIRSKPYFTTYLRIFGNGSTSGIFPPLLMDNVSAMCCKGQNISFKFVNETSRTSVQRLLFVEQEKREYGKFDNTTLDVFFPTFTVNAERSRVYKDFYFIEVMKSPGPAFIMLRSEIEEAPDPSMILIECWPIFVLLLIMAWVVGIIGWFLDRKKNQQQFPDNFYRGSWVGFWWAVVTMTTVGYGDKTPKSFPARLLTVLWMITGTIVTSLFTANVTTVLTTKNVAALQNVLGQKVGVLSSKHFFQRQINEGASFIEYVDEKSMEKAFRDKEITRILVPNYLDHLYFSTTNPGSKVNDFVIASVVKHPFSVGLGLVNNIRNLDDHEEMKEFLRCWEWTIVNNFEESGLDYSEIDLSLYHTAEDARSLLNQSSILYTIYGCLGLLFIFLVLGSTWEIWKHTERSKSMDTMEPSEIEMTKTKHFQRQGSQTFNF